METLVEKTPHEFIVFGGKEDRFCEDLAKGFSTGRVINTQGKLTIAESSSLIEKCDLVVANDTGLMHVADGLKIPSVLILGPTSGDLGCLPFHPLSQIVEEKMWCRPCSKNGEAICIRGKRYCLWDLTPQRVFEATLRLVKLCE
jgi:ADP-heptose:LPS heptosyltransferase